MSKVDQAKKEAKRLFNLAQNNNNSVKIENLSQAKEILSTINGYKHWYEYESNLKKQDIQFSKIDKRTQINEENNILENIGYFQQNISFNTVPAKEIKPIIFKEQQHIHIILATTEKKIFDKEEKKWILDQYPLLVSGSTGSGKTVNLFSLIGQYIKNKEGVIYFNGKGDISNHVKFFSYCEEYNRLNDYYVLNFISTYSKSNKNLSHTIDPINPMVGCIEYFEYFFGKFGAIIHEIAKENHENETFMTIEGLESTLMLNNLISWNNENKFKTPLIKEYLLSLGINKQSDINSLILENHAKNLSIAYNTIQIFKIYSEVFKVQSDSYFQEGYLGHIDMQKIFIDRKILLVMLPALEKSTRQLSKISDLITYQIKFVESNLKDVNSHFQNIVIDDAKYVFKDFFKENLDKSNNNYIFSINEISHNSDIENFLFSICKTKLIMKNEIYDIAPSIKLEIINNIKEFPKFNDSSNESFIKKLIRGLKNQEAGQGYIICQNNNEKKDKYIVNNKNSFYFEKVKAYYKPAGYAKNTYLINHNEV